MESFVIQRQESFIELFNELDDRMWQYELILQIAGEMEGYPTEKKDDAHLIAGCQSKTWLYCTCQNEKMKIYADSEALIIKGTMGVLAEVIDGASIYEVNDAGIDFIERTALKELLTADRLNGMQAIIAKVKIFAREKVHEKKNMEPKILA